MAENSGRFIDQMMAALAKKNLKQQQQDSLRDPVTGKIQERTPRGTGPVPHKKQARKASGRGR